MDRFPPILCLATFAGTHSYEVLGCVELPADALGGVTRLEGDVFHSDCCELAKCHIIAAINITYMLCVFVSTNYNSKNIEFHVHKILHIRLCNDQLIKFGLV